MPLISERVLNPPSASLQWASSGFQIKAVGTIAHPDNVFAVCCGTAGDLTGDGWSEIVIGGWSYRGFDATGTSPPVNLAIVSANAGGATVLDAQACSAIRRSASATNSTTFWPATQLATRRAATKATTF